jgi:hypothetical protein
MDRLRVVSITAVNRAANHQSGACFARSKSVRQTTYRRARELPKDLDLDLLRGEYRSNCLGYRKYYYTEHNVAAAPEEVRIGRFPGTVGEPRSQLCVEPSLRGSGRRCQSARNESSLKGLSRRGGREKGGLRKKEGSSNATFIAYGGCKNVMLDMDRRFRRNARRN